MPATLKDIAKRTNLSLGTVSNYINGKKIKEKNRVLIERAIRELDYSVNQLARGLKTNRSASVGIIMPTLDDPYAAKIASHLTSIFRANDYAVLVCESASAENEAEVVRFMVQKQVEGVISFPVAEDAAVYRPLDEKKIPYILIDRALKGAPCDVFLLNNREISRSAVRLAISRGHRKIGILAGEKGFLSADERVAGYTDALREAGIPVRQEYILRSKQNDQDGAIAGAAELTGLSDRPTAVFATNYFFTLGMVVACSERGLRLGREMHLIGLDDIMLNELIRPKLTIVAQPMREYAEKSAALLLGVMRGEFESPKKTHICEGYITEGETLGYLG